MQAIAEDVELIGPQNRIRPGFLFIDVSWIVMSAHPEIIKE